MTWHVLLLFDWLSEMVMLLYRFSEGVYEMNIHLSTVPLSSKCTHMHIFETFKTQNMWVVCLQRKGMCNLNSHQVKVNLSARLAGWTSADGVNLFTYKQWTSTGSLPAVFPKEPSGNAGLLHVSLQLLPRRTALMNAGALTSPVTLGGRPPRTNTHTQAWGHTGTHACKHTQMHRRGYKNTQT